MPSKGISFAGFHIVLTANRRALSLSWTVTNRLWKGSYQWVKSLLKGPGEVVAEPGDEGTTIVPQDDQTESTLLDRINAINWYHSIDLGNSLVTQGLYDHRPLLEKYCLPDKLEGKRVLDVATWDGFWAFEFEKRGAEVVGMDIPFRADVDLTPATRARLMAELTEEQMTEQTGKGFELAKETLGSSVHRELLNIYDLCPEKTGMFNVVHAGDILVHIKNPLKALENILMVTKDYAIISECFYPELDQLGGECLMDYLSGHRDTVWWKFGMGSLRQIIIDAGFEHVELKNTFKVGMRGWGGKLNHAVFWAFPKKTM